ncbi:MAG: DUF4404 family protein [Gammaproteobacteria bacterium]
MNEQLEETLAALRREVSKLSDLDPESTQKLESLIENLEIKLESPDDIEHHHSLTEGLSDSLTHFEVSHPRLTGILNDVMMALSNMGI